MMNITDILRFAIHIEKQVLNFDKLDTDTVVDEDGDILGISLVDQKTGIVIIAMRADYTEADNLFIDPNTNYLYIPLLNSENDTKKFVSSVKKMLKDYPTSIIHEVTHLLDNTDDAIELGTDPSVKDIMNNEHEARATLVELLSSNFKPVSGYTAEFIEEFLAEMNNEELDYTATMSSNKDIFYRYMSVDEYKWIKKNKKLPIGHAGNSRFFTKTLEFAIQHKIDTDNGDTQSRGNNMEIIAKLKINNPLGKGMICTSRVGGICKSLFFMGEILDQLEIVSIESI